MPRKSGRKLDRKPAKNYSLRNDPWVCLCEEVSPFIHEAITVKESTSFSALAEDSQVATSRIQDILYHRCIMVAFGQVDRITCALNLVGAFKPLGTINIYRNPTWSDDKYFDFFHKQEMDLEYAESVPTLKE